MNTLKLLLEPTWTIALLSAINFDEFTPEVTPGPQSRNAHAFIIPIILFYTCRLITPSQSRSKWKWFAWFMLNGTLAHRVGHTALWLHEQLNDPTIYMTGLQYRHEIFYIHAVLAHEVVLALFWLLPPVGEDPVVGPRAKMNRNWELAQGAWYMISASAIVQSSVWLYGGDVFDLALSFPFWLHLCGLRKAIYWTFYLENEAVWYVKDLARDIVRFLKAPFAVQVDQQKVRAE
jgi:hypothetical protein